MYLNIRLFCLKSLQLKQNSRKSKLKLKAEPKTEPVEHGISFVFINYIVILLNLIKKFKKQGTPLLAIYEYSGFLTLF